jgi:hypothetical protein
MSSTFARQSPVQGGICHPGGHLLPNPACVAGGAGAMNSAIPHAGVMVFQRPKTNMQLASCCTVQHHNSISKAKKVPGMNPTSVRRLCKLKIEEELHGGDPPLALTIEQKNWPKTMDASQDCFSCALGETEGPLACIIQDVATVPAEAGNPAGNHDAPENKMITRMPHQDAAGEDLPTCVHGQSKVWQTMSKVCRDNKCWTCIKPFQRLSYGHEAFQVLHAHCLGANHVNNMVRVAEAKLCQVKHCGEKSRCNFEQHLSTLNEQFQVLNNLKHCGFAGINESSKV